MATTEPAGSISMVPSLNLQGRVALLTGASSGIGAHWGRLLAAAGARVALCARRADRLERLRDAIIADGGKAIAVTMDVTDESSTIAAFDATEAQLGPVDTVIANAGTSIGGPTHDQPVEAVDQMMAINLRGVFLTAREGARRMMKARSAESGRGRIVLTSSITAYDVNPGVAVYSATKAAVVQLGRAMARDWIRQGINVNILCPGWIRTDLNAEWFDSPGGQKQVMSFPRKRLSRETDLDVPLLFLSSDLSCGVTGTTTTIDDGQSL